MTPALFSLIRFEHAALLFLRAGLGGLVCYHGYPLFTGGGATWAELGRAVAAIGVTVHFPVFGFIAALALYFGGMFVVLGLFTRIWSLLIGLTLAVAAVSEFRAAATFDECTHALALAIAFFSLGILGPGRLSLDEKFFG